MTEAEKRYFAETAHVLRREGFQVEQLENGHLNVVLNGQPLCEVNKIGGIMYRDVSTPERFEVKDRALKFIFTTAEYMRQMERAPPLQVCGLKDRCRVLADFIGTVLAAMPGQFGVEFATGDWDWDFNRDGVSYGHYFGGAYKGAKHYSF